MLGFNQFQRNPVDILKQVFLGNNIISRLILINTAVYVVIKLVSTLIWLFSGESSAIISPLGSWFALPSDFSNLASKPWTILTYMFLHEGFFHLFFNMIMLYVGGTIFQEYLSKNKLFWTYIIGGLSGAVFFIIAFNLFPVFEASKGVALALGASASVLAILIAVATYVPDYSIHLFLFGKVKLKWIALVMILLDVLSIQSGNAGGHIAHLGGAFWGFIYAYTLKNGNDLYKYFYAFKMPKFNWGKDKNVKFSTSRPKNGKAMDDEEYNKRRVASQQEIDRILDKISSSGYSSLTKNEKELLFKSSNKN